MGKGSKRRPMQVSREEQNLRWDLMTGKVQLSSDEIRKKIKEIRTQTGKP